MHCSILPASSLCAHLQNSVVVVTSEGKCHVFDLTADEGTADPAEWPLVIPAASATHDVPVNISRLLIADFGTHCLLCK